MIRPLLACLVTCLAASALAALELPASARLQVDTVSPLDSYDLPTGPYADGKVPVAHVEGQVERRSWRIDGGSFTSLQVLDPLRTQIEAQGYDIVFECAERDCGGFDFRFGTEVLPGPQMYVDLGDYRFLSARRGNGDAQSVLVSRSATAVFVQQIVVSDESADGLRPVSRPGSGVDPEAESVRADPPPETAAQNDVGQSVADQNDYVAKLVADGHVVMHDLDFKTGANELGDGPYGSLEALAVFIRDHDDYRIVFVGHTDSVGSLATNITLSKERAEAVRARILADYDVADHKIGAEGMGYLAPIASNLTETGRHANRRVEAILLPN